MGKSGRRGQRLVQDGATAREQQRRLIEEARAARRGEQIAEPHQPSRSKLDRVELPFYPDDLLPKMQQLLALQLRSERLSDSLGHHDSAIMDGSDDGWLG